MGKTRQCFNDPALGDPADCATALPRDVISEANVLCQSRIDNKNPAAGYTGQDFLTDVTTKPFRFEGELKQLEAVPAVEHWTSEEDFSAPFCGFGVSPDFADGCGFAGTTVIVSVGKKGKK